MLKEKVQMLTDWLFLLSEKSSEAAAAEAEGVTGEGAAAWEGAGERKAAYRQTCEKNIGAPLTTYRWVFHVLAYVLHINNTFPYCKPFSKVQAFFKWQPRIPPHI